ncbi:MAG: tetratricopeptide repeat protein [Phycisphaerales bacterium]
MDQRERFEVAAAVFLEASRVPADQVEALVEQRCAGDAELRVLVEQMLHMRDEPSVFATLSGGMGPLHERVRQHVADAPTITGGEGSGVWEPPDEHQGDQIGRYRLLELIGEGGFGRVWVAEQREPVQRRVALKIIKAGMDTRQVVARFEQERQALALMDHPNIAKVFDAGATDLGRPYFVMELCKGQDVAAYCDRNALSIPARLELFAQICSAVQHAHTKGVIHRDIKPGNILVATQDDKPAAKVIDFGIAKAIDSRLTEKTLFTQHRQLIGTPEYMSPEQAEGSLDIDTRTDIYSLGVLLYELLTGTTPFASRDLRSAAYGEIQRIIREVEPPKPSTRLSQSAETREQIARQRQTEPSRLDTLLRGELDWIVMKAMDKVRARRYGTAGALGEDVRRFLDGRAVVAAPPSTAYRVSKFVSRHRAAAIGVGAVAVALVLGMVGTSAGLVWALDEKGRADFEAAQAVAAAQSESRARVEADEAAERAIEAERQTAERAEQLERVSAFQAEMLGQVDATDAGATLQRRILERYDAALEREGVDQAQRTTRAAAFALELARVNATDTAAEMIDGVVLSPSVAAIGERFGDQPLVDASLRATLAEQYNNLGLADAALEEGLAALGARRRLLGENHPDTLRSELDVASMLSARGRYEEAEPMLVHALGQRRATLGPDDPGTIAAMVALADHYRASGQYALAEPMLREAVDRSRAVLGASDRRTLSAVNMLGHILLRSGRVEETLPLWQEAYETGLAAFGPDDKDVLVWTSNLGSLHRNQGDYDAARPLLETAMEGFRRVRGENHPQTLEAIGVYVALLENLSQFEVAEARYRDALDRCLRTLGPEHPTTIRARLNLGRLFSRTGRLAEAEPYLRSAYETRVRLLGASSGETISALTLLANHLRVMGQNEEAEAMYVSGIETARAVLGSDHSDTQSLVYQYGTLLIQLRRWADAEPYVREAAETKARVSGPDDPDTMRVTTNLARVEEQLGNIEAAEALYRDLAARFEARMGADSPDTIIAWANVAGLLVRHDRKAEAVPIMEDAVVRYERVFGPDNFTLGIMRNMHGSALVAAGRFAEAEAALLETERIYNTAQGVPDRTKQINHRNLAELYEAWEAAEPGQGYAEKAATWRALLPEEP